MKIDRVLLKSAMLEKRVTQTTIAKYFEVANSVVSAWFTREAIPDQYVVGLENLLGIDLKEMLQKAQQKKTKKSTSNTDSTLDFTDCLERISELKAQLQDKQLIIEMLQEQIKNAPMRQKQS